MVHGLVLHGPGAGAGGLAGARPNPNLKSLVCLFLNELHLMGNARAVSMDFDSDSSYTTATSLQFLIVVSLRFIPTINTH